MEEINKFVKNKLDAEDVMQTSLEKPIKEIARNLGIQPNCARSNRSRARGKLKTKFEIKSQQNAFMR